MVLLASPVTSVPAPRVTLPAPVSEPMVSVLPFTSKTAPADTRTCEVSGMTLFVPESCNVPPRTAVATPVLVFVPLNTSSPGPSLEMLMLALAMLLA